MTEASARVEALAALDNIRAILQALDIHEDAIRVIAWELADTLTYVQQVARLPDLAAAASRE